MLVRDPKYDGMAFRDLPEAEQERQWQWLYAQHRAELMRLLECGDLEYWLENVGDRTGIADRISSGEISGEDCGIVLTNYVDWVADNPLPKAVSFGQQISASEMINSDVEVEWLIDGLAVLKRDTLIAGPAKCLKTFLAVHAALSISSGTEFLGRYRCRKSRVLFMSAESGQRAMAYIMNRWRQQFVELGEEPPDVDIVFHTHVPNLTEPGALLNLRRYIKKERFEVVFIDPLYRAAPNVNTSSMHAFGGQVLADLSDVGANADATMVVIHHTLKSSGRRDEAPSMEDVHGAGVIEWMRQWWLVGRRRPFSPEERGKHSLWMNYGGSDGFSGSVGIDVNEGFDGNFRLEVMDRADSQLSDTRRKQEAAEKRELASQGRKQDQLRHDQGKILEALQKVPEGDSRRAIKGSSGLNSERFSSAVESLISAGSIQEVEVSKSGRTYKGIALRNGAPAEVGQVGF